MSLNKQEMLDCINRMDIKEAQFHLDVLNDVEYEMTLHGESANNHHDFWKATVRRVEQLTPENHIQRADDSQAVRKQKMMQDPNNTLSEERIDADMEHERWERARSNHDGPGLCTRCGAQTSLKNGQHGSFYGCNNFKITGCRGTRNFE